MLKYKKRATVFFDFFGINSQKVITFLELTPKK